MIADVRSREYALESLSIYWPYGSTAIKSLPIPVISIEKNSMLPPLMELISIPEWAADTGVNGAILVPSSLIEPGLREVWERVDWIGVAAWYLSGFSEREYERQHGPIHSYSFRLKKWDTRIWEHAWVNRIALFLRRWAAKYFGREEHTVCGPLPETRIILTHDVDAVEKTLVIRVKQGLFSLFNAIRNILQGKGKRSLFHLKKGFCFVFTKANYWCFDEICALEDLYGVRSCFNFYGRSRFTEKRLLRFLFDPSYDVNDLKIRELIQDLSERGWLIGLHQSYYSWNKALPMVEEKAAIESSLGANVSTCRQHWLRFSWEKTWKAQEEAGLRLDTTIGFNDRPGFRVGAALPFSPWDPFENIRVKIQAVPMILMDSHLYDYEDMSSEERQDCMKTLINEIKTVHGTATVVWHQRVFSHDYGWGSGYEELLQLLRDL